MGGPCFEPMGQVNYGGREFTSLLFFSGASRRALQGPPAPAGYPLRPLAQAGLVVDEEVEIEPGAVAFAAIGKVLFQLLVDKTLIFALVISP